MKTLPDGGVELDGVRLTKEQVQEIRETGWWIFNSETKEPVQSHVTFWGTF